MSRLSRLFAIALGLAAIVIFTGCQGLVPGLAQLNVTVTGGGIGTVTSTPPGINCPGTCTANFHNAGTITLTASPDNGFGFGGWTGCTAQAGSPNTCTVAATASITANFSATLKSINHIIFLAQENRSMDSYFGAMRAYWAAAGTPDQAFDGLPQFNPPANPALAPSVPGCNPVTSTPTSCHVNPATGDVGPPVPSFHFNTMCVENPSPSWDESHGDWNASDPVSPTPTLDGFARTAANDARNLSPTPFFDINGIRSMGYYDGTDLNYYYYMATAFATSDRWFSPVMTRTPPNREYLIAATSQGYVYQRGTNPPFNTPPLKGPTIFEALNAAGITWKIYVPTNGTPCASNPTDVACLISRSYLHDFTFGITIKNNPSQYQNNIVPVSQFFTDAQSGNLPQVAQIEPASSAGLDEHPSDADGQPPCCSVQTGAGFVSTLINSVMCGSNIQPSSANPCTPGQSWQDSVFILTFDEFGGFYDHVPPQPAVSPDGIPPVDLFPGDPCTSTTGPNCDFTYTGYRVPLIVVSPYAKKNFVSHTVTDYTAILKLIETRFGLTALTNRDAAQMDMSDPTVGFLDFNNPPWRTPPTPPTQNPTKPGKCYLNTLP
jgi:phospholipase C